MEEIASSLERGETDPQISYARRGRLAIRGPLRGRLLVVPVAVFLLVPPACGGGGSGGTKSLPRATHDRPDDHRQRQIHFVYAIPGGRKELDRRRDVDGTLTNSILLIEIWFRSQRRSPRLHVDTYHGLIFLYVALFTPASIWIMRGFFVSIPRELEDAAVMDGCSRFGAFVRIVLPISAPGIIATATFVFLLAWDELFFAWVLTSSADVQARTPRDAPITSGGFLSRSET